MAKNKKKISIIIPTRDRHVTLPYAIKSALSLERDDIEIVVCDNYSTEETFKVVSGFSDSRLVYHRTNRRISMVENFNTALQVASGEYVTFIGDDDCVVPGALSEIEKYMTPDIPVCWMRHPYFWPNSSTSPNRMCASMDNSFNQLPSDLSLSHMIEFFLSYQYYPSLYNSLIHRSIIDKILKHNRTVFNVQQFYIPGVISPDVFSAMTIMCFTDSYVFAGTPFSLSGISEFSNGMGASNNFDNKDSRIFAKEFGKNKLSDMFYEGLPKIESIYISLLSDYLLFIDSYWGDDTKLKYNVVVSACKYMQDKKLLSNSDIANIAKSFDIEMYAVSSLRSNIAGGNNSIFFDIDKSQNNNINCALYGVTDVYHAGILYNDIRFNGKEIVNEDSGMMRSIKNIIKKILKND